MIQSPKILWGEGLFLRPQHFQQQDAYHEWRLAQMSRLLHPYAWGVRHVKIDPDALQTGLLRLLELQVVLPDGELFNAPGEDELPPAVALSSIAQDGAGEAVCVIRTLSLRLIRFNEMSAELAALEGEGDLSLAYWQQAHQAFFAREGSWSPDMELVFEEFAVIEVA